MVHLQLVPEDRKERRREQRRQRFLDAAVRIVDRDGLEGITMQAVADELDCAVGTIYSYFNSKAALVAALQGRAVDTLRASFATAEPAWDEALEGEDLPADLASLVHLVGFSSFWSAASVVYADEFALQRQLLSTKVSLLTVADTQGVMPVARRLFDQPARLLDRAVEADALEPGEQRERVLRWLAAMNGVLLLDRLAPVDRHLFRATHLTRALTYDLLVGWGAERSQVEVAAGHVERLSALGPMAPPPDLPGFT